MKKIISILIILVLAVSGCTTQNSSNGKIKIVTTIYPIYDMVYNSLKGQEDKYEIVNIFPEGADPHSYELTPENSKNINDADYVFYMSDEFESFMTSTKVNGKGIEIVNEPEFKKVFAVHTEKSHSDEHNEEEHHDEENHNEENHTNEHNEEEHHNHSDEHVWVSPSLAIGMNNAIGNVVCKEQQFDCDLINKNMGEYNLELKRIVDMYSEVGSRSTKTLYTSHDAFGLLNDYGFVFKGIYGAEHDDEPTSSDIAAIITDINQNDINAIYKEQNEQHDDVINQIARQTNSEVLEITNLVSVKKEEFDNHKSIIELYEYNLNQFKGV